MIFQSSNNLLTRDQKEVGNTVRIKSIRKIKPEPARCIEVDSPDRLFAAGGEDGHSIVSHNSVVQRNILFSAIMRPNEWRVLGIDLKKVELSAYRAYSNVVLGIATTIEDALTILRFAQQTMMKRYAEMEQLGVNNFLDLPEKGQALLVMADEMGELLSPSGIKALVESTIIPTPQGYTTLGKISIGDTIFDNFGKETVVTNKYEPTRQDRFQLSISSDLSGDEETFIAGSEHYWVIYKEAPDRTIHGPETVTTAELQQFQEEQELLPYSQRTIIKFKRDGNNDFPATFDNEGSVEKDLDIFSKVAELEWFTLDEIVTSDNTETLYCISVDSAEKQFLIGSKLHLTTHNTDEGKEIDALKGEAAIIIGSIARLGRAAGVHLVLATQRPDATILAGETKANLGVRINCGRTDSNASLMILGNGEGTRVRANPRGRLYLRIYGNGNHGQGFFAEQNWIDKYLEGKGLNADGTPIGNRKSKLANLADMAQFEEGDLDSREGVDNSKAIEKIRDEESSEDFDNLMDEEDSDWGFEEESTTEDKMGRPELVGGDSSMDQFHRPEEDWDMDLEDLINENND